MSQANLEHVNITVSDPQKTAAMLCGIFEWQVRWHGPSQMGGHTYHVGTPEQYLAVYSYDGKPVTQQTSNGLVRGGLNHVGVLVENLDEIEQKVMAAGFTPFGHENYEPGRRFYFNDADEIEYEVVSYR